MSKPGHWLTLICGSAVGMVLFFITKKAVTCGCQQLFMSVYLPGNDAAWPAVIRDGFLPLDLLAVNLAGWTLVHLYRTAPYSAKLRLSARPAVQIFWLAAFAFSTGGCFAAIIAASTVGWFGAIEWFLMGGIVLLFVGATVLAVVVVIEKARASIASYRSRRDTHYDD